MNERERITFNVRWFIKHGHYWKDRSGEATEVQQQAAGIVIPAGTLDWPGFGSLKAKYTATATTISDQYGQGATQTEKTGELLETAGKMYARTEADNEALSNAILADLADEF